VPLFLVTVLQMITVSSDPFFMKVTVDCSTQLKFIRTTVARRLKDTHENNGDKQTNETIKKSKNNERTSQNNVHGVEYKDPPIHAVAVGLS